MELHKVRAVLKFESLLTVRQIRLFAPINVGRSHIMSSYVTSWKWRCNAQFIFLRLSEKKAEQNASRGNLLSLFFISAGTFNAKFASQGLWGKYQTRGDFHYRLRRLCCHESDLCDEAEERFHWKKSVAIPTLRSTRKTLRSRDVSRNLATTSQRKEKPMIPLNLTYHPHNFIVKNKNLKNILKKDPETSQIFFIELTKLWQNVATHRRVFAPFFCCMRATNDSLLPSCFLSLFLVQILNYVS